MKYRREIDGLRAVAVVPVVLFHAGFTVFGGGYVGVDVFFVISGYLITSIIISELEQGHFSLLHFYERRARRILPALFFVMVVCIPFAWLWMLPSQFKDFSQSIVAVSLFASNILFWRESDYFAAAAEEKPLLHTWSLAVEEQFYVFFPIALILLWKFGRNPVFYGIVAVSLASLLLSEWGWRNAPEANFYLLPTRAWELLTGSICAFLQYGKPQKSSNALSALGLALIVFSVFYYDHSTPFPSAYALVPVTGTALIILYGANENWTARLLSHRVFVGIGIISYSAYLWHQPLFAFARIRSVHHTEQWLMLAIAFVSLLLAYFSWRFIEQPFRTRSFPALSSQRTVFFLSGIFSAAFVTFGALGILKQPIHFTQQLQILDYQPDNIALQQMSWSPLRNLANDSGYEDALEAYQNTLWFDLEDSRKKILLVGNSHSKDVYNVISSSRLYMNEFQIARFGTQIRDVVAADSSLLESENYVHSDVVFIVSRYSQADIDHMDQVVTEFISDGKLVVVVKNIYEFRNIGDRNLADIYLLPRIRGGLRGDKAAQAAQSINEIYYNQYASVENPKQKQNEFIDQLSEKHPIIILDRMDYVCADETSVCYAIDNRLNKFFYDYGHHTLEGAQFFAGRVDAIDWLAEVRKRSHQ